MSEQEKVDKKREMAGLIVYWQSGGNSFGCKLLTLIQTADPVNRDKIRQVFPDHVAILEEWAAAPDGDVWLDRAMLCAVSSIVNPAFMAFSRRRTSSLRR